MILNGRIDEKNQLWVEVTVCGESTEHTLDFLLDTGFSGEVQIPVSVAVPLGLKLRGVAEFELADGKALPKLLFEGTIRWGSAERAVTAIVSPSKTPLLGSGLLTNYELVADFKSKTFIIKEPETAESPQRPSSLSMLGVG